MVGALPKRKAVAKDGKKKRSLTRLLGEIAYSMDNTSMFASHAAVSKANEKKKRRISDDAMREVKKRFVDAAKASGKNCKKPRRPFIDNLMDAAALEHFTVSLARGDVISAPRSACAQLVTLTEKLGRGFNPPCKPADAIEMEDDCGVPDQLGEVAQELAAPVEEPVDPDVFLKVIKVSGGRAKILKTAPASGSTLKHVDVAVTLHRAVHVGHASGKCILSGAASAPGFVSHVLTVPMTDLASSLARHRLRKWSSSSTKSSLLHCVTGLEDDQSINSVVTKLVAKQCYVNNANGLVPSNECETKSLEKMQRLGYTASDAATGSWRLTSHGCKFLSHLSIRDRAEPVFPAAPPRPLLDSTKFELLVYLKEQGWTLKRSWPSKKGIPPPYAIQDDAPKIFYASGVKTQKSYYLALATADTLKTDLKVLTIHHQQNSSFYDKLITKGVAVPRIALEDDHEPGGVDPLADAVAEPGDIEIEHDHGNECNAHELDHGEASGDEGNDEVQGLLRELEEDADSDATDDSQNSSMSQLASLSPARTPREPASPAATPALEPRTPSDPLGSDSEDVEAAWQRAKALPDHLFDDKGNWAQGPAADPAATAETEPSSPALQPENMLLDIGLEEALAEVMPDEPDVLDDSKNDIFGDEDFPKHEDAEPTRRRRDLMSHDWGPFFVAYIPPANDTINGAWKATCKFHRKANKKRDYCMMKKSCGPEEGSTEQTLTMMKWWLLAGQAEGIDRAWKHSLKDPRLESFIPDAEVLDEQVKSAVAAPTVVLTDAELDDVEGVDVKEEPQPKARSQKVKVEEASASAVGKKEVKNDPAPKAKGKTEQPPRTKVEQPEPAAPGGESDGSGSSSDTTSDSSGSSSNSSSDSDSDSD